LEKLAASRMPESAIEHYRESRIPGRLLNKREKHEQYLVCWKGYPPGEATWEPWENPKGEEALRTSREGCKAADFWEYRMRVFRLSRSAGCGTPQDSRERGMAQEALEYAEDWRISKEIKP
jgi:hypothetical protein